MRSMMLFPLIGAAIGLWGAVFFNAAAVLLPQSLAAAASTLATVHITGCFHEDGLADVFDGFGEAATERRGAANIVRVARDLLSASVASSWRCAHACRPVPVAPQEAAGAGCRSCAS